MEKDKEPDHKPIEFKICIAGPSHVGKSQIINRIINNAFYNEYYMTDELEEYQIVINLSASETLRDILSSDSGSKEHS